MLPSKRLVPLVLLVLVGFLLLSKPGAPTRAQNKPTRSRHCCGPAHPTAPRELDFAYYSLKDGFTSTLNLVSDSPQPLDFTLTVHSRSGQTVVAPKMTIQPQAKLPIDMAALLAGLNADITGDFSEGSVAVNFVGTIMPLVGQMTITNPALGLIHEAEMIENDPGRSDIAQELDGLWWNLSGGRDAKIMVTNTSGFQANADVFLDFAGTRHPSAVVSFRPHETKMLSVTELLGELNVSAAAAAEGGVTIIQRELTPTLIAQGKVLDPVTGFSTTLTFPDPQVQMASALHASGVPIGKPTNDSPFARTGYFTPHVVLRNLTGAAQAATITVEHPTGAGWGSTAGPAVEAPTSPSADSSNGRSDSGTTTGQLTLAPLDLEPYSTVDFSLDAVMNQLPLPLPFCSIRIQYSGRPGWVIAEVSSVEAKSDMVIDAFVANEGNGWAGSGANPWHLDDESESFLFLTDEGDKPARIAFTVTSGGVHYYLTRLRLDAHETRLINLRKLRDGQQADFQGTVIPAGATDGAVTWQRGDNVPVSGHLLVMKRHGGTASDYDCNVCNCPVSFNGGVNLENGQGSVTVSAGNTVTLTLQGSYTNPCNYTQYWMAPQGGVSWSSGTPSVATVDGSGDVYGVSGGSSTISVFVSELGCYWNGQGGPGSCQYFPAQGGAGLAANVPGATISSAQQITDGLSRSFAVTASGGTPSSYAWSFTSPQGAGNNPNVNFTPNNGASTTTDGHWFALPNSACTASLGAVYTITATVTFPGNVQVAPHTTLTVNLLVTAGLEPIPYVLGYPAIGQNSQGIWVVTGPGTLSRSVQSPIIYFASSSQFYNKVVAHENRHVQQWTSGMNSDLYLVSSLMTALSPLTSSTQDGLKAQISNTWNQSWAPSQNSIFQSRLAAAEADAYSVSDPIAPLYFYQSSCGGGGM